MDNAQWAAVCTLVFGALGQQLLHAPKAVDNRIAAAIVVVVAFGLYWLGNPVGPDMRSWIFAGVIWTCSAGGAGTLLSKFGVLAKTDTIPSIHTELPQTPTK